MKDNKIDELIDSIIRNHVIWSVGGGVIPIPIADLVAVTAIQVDMVRQMSRAYNIDYDESAGKTLIMSLVGSGVARLGSSFIKAIPVVGTIVGGASTAILSGASTYAIGKVFKRHFSLGGTFLDFDLIRLKKYYDEQFEKGKDVAKNAHTESKENTGTDSVENVQRAANEVVVEPKVEVIDDGLLKKLRELDQLKNAGVIDEEEFVKLKKKLIN